MSVVTGFVLMCSVGEDLMAAEKPPSAIAHINAWLAAHGFMRLVDSSDDFVGNKHPQSYIYHAGFNHFPEDAFIAFFATLEWERPDNVVLVMTPEEGTTRVIRPVHEVWGHGQSEPYPAGQTLCL